MRSAMRNSTMPPAIDNDVSDRRSSVRKVFPPNMNASRIA
jgi:hypothetical protein